MGGCCATRPILGEPVSLFEKVDSSDTEEKKRPNSWKNNSSTIIGENKSKRSIDVNMLKSPKLEFGCIQESDECMVMQSTKYIGTESTAKKLNVENILSSISERSQNTEIDGNLKEAGEDNVESTYTIRLQNTNISNMVAEYSAVDTANKPAQNVQEVKPLLVLNISKALS